MQDGIILIDKPTHMTSFGVVARVRRQLGERLGVKKVKVGHTGTLDPFATGLMILVIGKECKNAERYSKLDKVYEATIRLGERSSTADPEGEITHVSDMRPERSDIEAVLSQFTGEIEQIPPMYSAIKIDGQRAYRLARKGEVFEVPKRLITIHSLDLLEYRYPELRIKAHVSSGTYIRTLAEDIGGALGTGAYCRELRRTRIADWRVEDVDQSFDLTS